jgi:hypothetical protein
MEFVNIHLDHMQPTGICDKCAEAAIFHLPTQTAIVYCKHFRKGAYLPVGSEHWSTISNIDTDIFNELVVRGLTMGELRSDLRKKWNHIIESINLANFFDIFSLSPP